MAPPDAAASGSVTPVAVVWCRQVDNEAESPGYTTIPEEFPGRRETLEAIRIVGNLTINVADTHDYWDPEPGQPLSYYPNLFLYPAAGGRYTCVGRMFLSTEDRPRLGMKTLVLETAALLASGEFGAAVLRAHASMGSRTEAPRPSVEPDTATYQAVGEGFLFHRGTTEPVVLVAAEQWDGASQVVRDLVRLLPSSLVALGAFLVFPYFLPEAKVNIHEFTEQVPLALAILRVPKGEAQGERHAKRIASWDDAPVTLRDLTKPPTGRGKETIPLVLQYVRDHAETKIAEVARRVDQVDIPRTKATLDDPERQAGRDRRKAMWRIGTAMETAALVLSRPKGRSVPMSGETAKRANEYLQARPPPARAPAPDAPATSAPASAAPSDPTAPAPPSPSQHPPWLQGPAAVAVPPSGPVAVPVSVTDDPSLRPAPKPAESAAPSPASDEEITAWVKREVDLRFAELARGRPSGPEPALLDLKVQTAVRDLEAKWDALVDARFREMAESQARSLTTFQKEILPRVGAVEARPSVNGDDIKAQVDRALASAVGPRIAEISGRLSIVEARPNVQPADLSKEVSRGLQTGLDAKLGALESRLAAIEGRPALRSSDVTKEVERSLAGGVDPKLAAVDARLAAVESRPSLSSADVSKEVGRSLSEGVDTRLGGIESRIAALETRPFLSSTDVSKEVGRSISTGVDGRFAGLEGRVAVIEARPAVSPPDVSKEVARSVESGVGPRVAVLEARLAALELRPALGEGDVGARVEKSLRSTVDPRFAALEEKMRQAVAASGEAWAGRVRTELQTAVDDLAARSARAEEEVRAALVAQLELEIAETKEQGASLREEIESRVRDVLKEREQALEQRRAKDVRELEQKLGVLVDGRSKDLETRMSSAIGGVQDRALGAADERLAQLERRLSIEQEARAAEVAESQTQSLAGFQVRMQSFFEQKLRENQERERDKYVELLARFKGEMDQALSRTMDSGRFDAAVQERVARAIAQARADQEKAIGEHVTEAELRLRVAQDEGVARLEQVESKLEAREAEVSRVERTLRHDLEELDRRVEVLTDRMLPLVRKTWVKVGEMEKGGPVPVAGEDDRVKELRREIAREIRRVEGEMLEQTSELRDKLESTLQSQGRIWLNFVRQLSAAGEEMSPSGPSLARGNARRAIRSPVPAPDDDVLDADLTESGRLGGAFDEDPVNPLDPEANAPPGPASRDARRRARRS